MQFDDRPQLPLTSARRTLVIVGVVLFVAHVAAAALLARPMTGDDANVVALAGLLLASVAIACVTTLCVVRQADIPDVFTAAMLSTITPAAVFAVVAALDARGTSGETDVVSAMFFGITVGALAGLVVWGIAMGVARLLHLPTTDGIEGQ